MAVLEVGLGGRLDATNVAEPLASAIVSVDFDHEVYLGPDARRDRAREGRRAARRARDGPGPARRRGARAPSRAQARAHAAPASSRRARGARLARRAARPRRPSLRPAHAAARYRGLRPLPGAHQRDNLLVAVRLLEEARARGARRSTSSACRGAVARTRWPGRLQRVPGRSAAPARRRPQPRRRARARRAPARRARRSCSCSARWPTRTCAASPGRSSRSRAGSCSRAPRCSRAATPDELARRAGRLAPRRAPRAAASAARSPSPAASRARAGPRRPVVVAGSLYLVGAVLALLEREQARLKAAAPRGSRVARSTRGQTIVVADPGPLGHRDRPVAARPPTGGSTRSSSK